MDRPNPAFFPPNPGFFSRNTAFSLQSRSLRYFDITTGPALDVINDNLQTNGGKACDLPPTWRSGARG